MKLLILFLLLSGKIDLNKATLEELKNLPIGFEDAEKIADSLKEPLDYILSTYKVPEWKACSIYVYREKHGPFRSFYDLSRVPLINPGDLKRWRYLLTVTPFKEGRNFSFYVERIRMRGASEESPREYAFDQWISYLVEPIYIRKASIDELNSLAGVSLLDAVAVIKQVKRRPPRNLRDLRRTPGLTYYGYRNLRNFVTFKEPSPRPLRGWIHIDSYFGSSLYTSSSELAQRINTLEGGIDSTLVQDLYEAGWDSSDVASYTERLRREKEDVESVKSTPYFRAKSRISLFKNYKFGWLYYRNPFDPERPIIKGFTGVEKLGPINKLIVGNYRVTLGQGLLIDNTDEIRDRTIYRTRGLYGDITGTREFALFGAALELKFGPLKPLFFYSDSRRDAIPDRDGEPLFYYTGSFVPQPYREKFSEKLKGLSLRYDLPSPLPLGTQIAFNYLGIERSDTLTGRWEDLDIPGDRDSLKGDPSFLYLSFKKRNFYGVEFRTVLHPVALHAELAHMEDGGDAFLLYTRLQKNIFYVNFIVRHYEPSYANPYMRPFQEDGRFEDTPIERPYRLLDPLASELKNFPMPKPETGFYLETRLQPLRQLLTPRTYIDVWKDNTDGLWNYRIQAEVEFRPAFAFRVRYREKWQLRRNLRGLSVTRSFLREQNLRLYIFLSGYDFLEFEGRYSKVDLTARESYPEEAIDGGFIRFAFNHNFGEKYGFRFGAILWKTNGLSQWSFEDTGIDFLYGNGYKYYFTLLERLSPNLNIKLKLRKKITKYPHFGLFGQEIRDPEGNLLTGFLEEEPYYSIEFGVDYGF